MLAYSKIAPKQPLKLPTFTITVTVMHGDADKYEDVKRQFTVDEQEKVSDYLKILKILVNHNHVTSYLLHSRSKILSAFESSIRSDAKLSEMKRFLALLPDVLETFLVPDCTNDGNSYAMIDGFSCVYELEDGTLYQVTETD